MQKEDLINLSKEELIDKVLLMDKQVIHFSEELEHQEHSHFEWSGNLGKWSWDFKNNKVDFNPKKVTALGYSLEEIPSEVGHEFFTSKLHPEDYEMVMQNMRDHLESVTEAYECEYRIKSKIGEWKWYYDRGVVVERDQNKQPLKLVGIVFDITSKKEAESELASKNAQLLQLNKNNSLMLSIIGHDLRGPLGAMDSLLNDGIIDMSSLAGKTELLKEFSSSISSLYSLVNDLLEWAALQKGDFELKYADLSIFDVSQLAIDQLKLLAEKKEIHIVNTINPVIKLNFDEEMILTVIRNLVSNAIKYTPKYGQIKLFDKVIDGKMEITIKDNGIGIRPENIDKILSLSSSKSTKGTEGEKGTGLGLVLCKGFVEKNGGSLYVESELGEGSSFKFTLPLNR